MSSYDYVIVGAGSSGCVLAERLTADPANRVVLIESGPADRHPAIQIPKGFALTNKKPGLTYQYMTQPFGPTGQIEFWTRGKVLGGSSSINGTVYNRGSKADFDSIEALGNPGWGWDDILPAFKAIEDHELGGSDMRGSGGPLKVSVSQSQDEAKELLFDAAGAIGLERVDDVNASDTERIGYTPATIHRGVRQSAAKAFLRPATKRSNLTVLTETQVTRVLFEGDRAVGVELRPAAGGETSQIRADREVILSAGSIATPQILELSGIGPRAVLEEAGVDVRVDSPRVGEGIWEHRCIQLQMRLKRDIGYNRRLRSIPRQGREGARYLATRKGPLATPAYDLMSFLKSTPDAPRPDAQVFMSPFSMGPLPTKFEVEDRPGLSLLGFGLRPTSEAQVHIASADPAAPPRITPSYLATPEDRAIALATFRRMRELITQSPLADVVHGETVPGAAVEDDESLLRSAFLNGGTGYHASGACAMGPADTDAIDARLRVRGTQGLRVVDVSIMPVMVSGNLNGPAMAMAWRAADLILQDR